MRWMRGWLSGWLALAFGAALSQQWVDVRFLDAVSGRALAAEAVFIHQETQQTYAFQAQSDGRLSAYLPEGEYLLYALHAGYQPVGFALSVNGQTPPYRVYFDPLAPPRETDWRFLWSLRKPEQMVVVGFITDEQTGQPLEGVRVRVLNHTGEATTDAQGMFLIQFPIRDAQGQPQPYATLVLEKAGYQTLLLEYVQLWSEGDWIYRLTMEAGTGIVRRDMRSPRHREQSLDQPCTECDEETKAPQATVAPDTPQSPFGDFFPAAPAPIVLPKYIRVGRNCTSRTNCPGGVEVYTIDTYCKGVITSEWYACWGNVRFGSENPPAGMESLKAGAVAVRSYGVSFVYTPISSSYDICDSTHCQVFTGNQTSNGNAAVDATTRYVLLTSAGNIARSEYSAENNNSGCGDGYSGTGSSWPCIADPVCLGFAANGHGRGMCQWGSARWATGRRLSSSQACTSSAPLHGYGTKNWQQILSHYYTPGGYRLVQGGVATIQNLAISPNPVRTGTQAQLTYTINATHDFQVMLGASIRLGAGAWISDPARDVRVSLVEGINTRSRMFAITADATAGNYDVLTALWFDRNNSNTINTGDFIVDDRVFAGALQVRRATTLSVPAVSGRRGQTVALQATLRQSLDNAPLSGRTLRFFVSNTLVGNATTDSAGVASLTYAVPLTTTVGSQSVRVEFAGDSTYADATGSSMLEVLPVRVQGQVALQGIADPQGIPMRFTLTQGNQQQQLDLTLGAGGSFAFDTMLAGTASVRVSTPNGVWLCAQTEAMLSDLVTLNFSLRAGDLNQDGTINNADLLLVLFAFGTSNPQADVNRDGVVNNADLLLVLFNFGAAC
ncbi:MAG: SpoIID/LytB domain-containing protein [Armatimonadota bacterium]|nr:SpoIID/LytB domain-containing protein [Armatimonadota bacterium]